MAPPYAEVAGVWILRWAVVVGLVPLYSMVQVGVQERVDTRHIESQNSYFYIPDECCITINNFCMILRGLLCNLNKLTGSPFHSQSSLISFHPHSACLVSFQFLFYFLILNRKDLFKCQKVSVFFLSPREISWILSPDNIK